MNIIKFHYTYYIISISFLLTGQFLNLIIFTSLIITHELGHYIACLLVSIRVKKIIIYPYGGVTKIDDIIDIEFSKELLISIFGIVFQTVYYFFIYYLYKNSIIRSYTYNLFCNYHYSMLTFNLLPIYPLDGSKLLNIIINKIFNYKISNFILFIINYMKKILINLSILHNLKYFHL